MVAPLMKIEGARRGTSGEDMEFGPCQFERLVRHPSGAAKIVV